MYEILWVCQSSEHMAMREKQFGQGEGVMFICAGWPLCGRGFNEIFIDVLEPHKVRSKKQRAMEEHWFEHLTTKLYPKGRIYKLTDDQI